MNHPFRTAARTLALTLAAALAFTALAEDDLKFGIYDDEGRIVGTVDVEYDDDRSIDVELLRGFEGFVRIVVPGADGVNQVFDGAIGPDGLVVIVDGFFIDAAEFMARFGDDLSVRIEFEDDVDDFGSDDFGTDDGDRDDDASRDDDDDDGDRDDDASRDDDDDDGDRDDDGDASDDSDDSDDDDDDSDDSDDDEDDDGDDDSDDDGDDDSDD